MEDKRPRVLALIRSKDRPVTPRDIAKAFSIDTTFAGAYLSELSASKGLLVTHVKHGGTPFYYLRGQELKLQCLDKYLNDKDKKAYDLLKLKLVLEDRSLTPILRVALRYIKDFAVPLYVNVNGNKMLFWKWYLASDSQVSEKIKLFFPAPIPSNPSVQKEPLKSLEKGMPAIYPVSDPQPLVGKTISEKQSPPGTKNQTKKIDYFQKQVNASAEKNAKSLQWYEQQLVEPANDDFFSTVKDYFKEKNIGLVSVNIIKKRSDLEFIINVPSVVGKIKYYCRAKNKKRCNDGDLSSAYVQAMSQKLPALFLMTGDLTKKAKSMLDTELKNHVVAKQIR